MEFIVPENVTEWRSLLEEFFKSSKNKSVIYTGITYSDIRKAPQIDKKVLFTDLCNKFGEVIYLIDNQKSDFKNAHRSHSVGRQHGQAHNIQKLKTDLISAGTKKIYGHVYKILVFPSKNVLKAHLSRRFNFRETPQYKPLFFQKLANYRLN